MNKTDSRGLEQLTTTGITLLDINFGEIADASDLDVVLGTNKVDAFEGAVRDNTRTSAALGAPSDLDLLRVSNVADRRGCPETEIVGVVHPHGLAHGGLGRFSTAVVSSGLTVLGLGRELVVAGREEMSL